MIVTADQIASAALYNIGGGPKGVLSVSTCWDPILLRRRLCIDRADPEIEITDELLHHLTGDMCLEPDHPGNHPGIELIPPPEDQYDTCGRNSHRGLCFVNAILRVTGEERSPITPAPMRTVIYKVIEYSMERNAWVARWPD